METGDQPCCEDFIFHVKKWKLFRCLHFHLHFVKITFAVGEEQWEETRLQESE